MLRTRICHLRISHLFHPLKKKKEINRVETRVALESIDKFLYIFSMNALN